MNNSYRKLEIVTWIFLIVSFCCYRWHQTDRFPDYDRQTERKLREYVDTNRTYAISDQQAVRQSTPGDMDATDQFLYLKYSSDTCVDVYNLDGEFLYAILLPDVKGGIGIRCVDNQLYILDSTNTLYIFEGREEIACLNYEEATAHGYDFFWFQEKNDFQKKEGKYLYKYDESGECILQVEIPQNTAEVNFLRLIIFLASLFVYLYFMISALLRKYRGET